VKRVGKRSAGKPHAAFDVAGAGNGEMTRLRGTIMNPEKLDTKMTTFKQY